MPIIMLFPGQGSQFCKMGQDFYEQHEIVRNMFKNADNIMGFSLSDIILNGTQDELTLTTNAQPAIFLISACILQILNQTTKIRAIATAGHSLGEYTALYAAGSFDFATCLKLIKIRSKCMLEAEGSSCGTMAALIGCESPQVKQIIDEASKYGVCEIANDNGASQFVISGSNEAIQHAMKIAKNYGIKKAVQLKVSGAFHSSLVKPALAPMQDYLSNIGVTLPKIPVIANVKAAAYESTDEIKSLLAQQIYKLVKWRDTINYLASNYPDATFLEIGPGSVLTNLLKRTHSNKSAYSISSIQDVDSVLSTQIW